MAALLVILEHGITEQTELVAGGGEDSSKIGTT